MAVLGSAIIQVSADTAKIQKDLGKVKGMFTRMEKDVRKTGKSMRSALDISKIVLGAVAVLRTLQKAWDVMLEGARAEQATKAFSSIVTKMGGDVRAEFERIKKASGGMISDADIRKQSSIAVSLGIPIENVAGLMEVARLKARDMGTTITSAFEDIAKGVGRGSRLILDNLGIILKLEEANKKYAESIDKTVDQLTEYDKKQAIINATMVAGEEALTRYDLSVLNTIEKLQKAEASVKNLKDKFTELTAGLVTNSIGFGLVMDALDRLSERGRMAAELELIESKLTKAKNKMDEMKNGMFGFLASDKAIARLQEKIDGLLKRSIELKKELFSHSGAERAKTPPPDLTEAERLKVITTAFNIEQARLGLLKETDNLLASTATTRNQEISVIKEKISTEKKSLEILKDYHKELKKSGSTQEAEALRIQTRMTQTEIKIESLMKKQKELTGSFTEGWSNAINKFEKDLGTAFKRGEQMAKTVAGAMTSAFDTLFFNIMQGKMTSFKELMMSFLSDIQRALSEMLARIIAVKLISGVTSAATSFFSGGSAPQAPTGTPKMHDGGFVKKLHNGGLASDEVPAILQTGEGVVSRKGMTALDKINEGQGVSGGGGDTYVLIQANDTQSFIDALNRNAGGIIKILSDDLRRSGPSRRAIQSAG